MTLAPPANSDAGAFSQASALAVPYAPPTSKRARPTVPSAYAQLVGYSGQSVGIFRHRLVPPPPIPLQNGVDGFCSSASTSGTTQELRAAFTPPTAQWQGFPSVPRLSSPAPWSTGPLSLAREAQPPPTRPPPRQIGIYSPQERRERIRRFHAKRGLRVFHKRIKYACRKRLANACPRIKGRFVRRDEYLAAVERGQRATHPRSPSSESTAD